MRIFLHDRAAPLVVFALLMLAATAARGEESKGAADASSPLAASVNRYRRDVVPFVDKHCGECHGSTLAEKELNLTALDPDMLASPSAARWVVVLEKLRSGEMPPKEMARPTTAELSAVTAWIEAEMKRSGKHLARREAYQNGNLIDHATLFDPKRAGKIDTPAGVRRFSPEIYTGFTADFTKGIPGIGQPFSAVGKTTFKDMGAPKLDEPTTGQLIRNALLIVEQRLTAFKVESGAIKAAHQGAPKQFLRLLDDSNPATQKEIEAAIKLMFEITLRRAPSPDEMARFIALYGKNVKESGRIVGARYTLATVLMLPEAVFRMEQGTDTADERGLVRLRSREIAFALAYALGDRRPEPWLLTMADKGELNTSAGIAKGVQRILDDPKADKSRILRFFREYFQYAQAEEVFKDSKQFPDHDARVLIDDTDRLVQYFLEQDKDVLFELLTTNKSFVAYRTAADTKKKRADELAKFEREKLADPKKFEKKKPPKTGRSIYESYSLADFPDTQPVELPADQRAGILTQPSWLVAFSKSDENHAILRGKWIRERLLGNVVPDLPITVDAQLPIAPQKTLRERMAVTQEQYCYQCHKLMNRVGYPFEMYDHLGRFRTQEPVLDLAATAKNVNPKGKHLGDIFKLVPTDPTGGVELTGDTRIEGDVKHAVEMMRRLARSERVEQVFVRHAFRYWMGRNETLGDAASLQAAHRAYKASGGSMKALITSLLTSDSFLYRVPASIPAAIPAEKSSEKSAASRITP